MDIKQKYREKFNKEVYSDECCMQPTSSYSDEYVRWLEQQVKNCSIPNVVGQSEQFYCDGQENGKDRCETQCLGCVEMQEIYGQ
jgi:hypothetical protein